MLEPFTLTQLEPESWRQDLTEAGAPTQVKQQIVPNAQTLVSDRRWGNITVGFDFCGGINSHSEEFALVEKFQ